MDKTEYLGFIAILQNARDQILGILPDLSNDPRADGAMPQRVRAIGAELDKAIQAYREKVDAPRP
ncbi:MAG: hypothetical protein WBD43_11420 [Methylovirgula sp.]